MECSPNPKFDSPEIESMCFDSSRPSFALYLCRPSDLLSCLEPVFAMQAIIQKDMNKTKQLQ